MFDAAETRHILNALATGASGSRWKIGPSGGCVDLGTRIKVAMVIDDKAFDVDGIDARTGRTGPMPIGGTLDGLVHDPHRNAFGFEIVANDGVTERRAAFGAVHDGSGIDVRHASSRMVDRRESLVVDGDAEHAMRAMRSAIDSRNASLLVGGRSPIKAIVTREEARAAAKIAGGTGDGARPAIVAALAAAAPTARLRTEVAGGGFGEISGRTALDALVAGFGRNASLRSIEVDPVATLYALTDGAKAVQVARALDELRATSADRAARLGTGRETGPTRSAFSRER